MNDRFSVQLLAVIAIQKEKRLGYTLVRHGWKTTLVKSKARRQWTRNKKQLKNVDQKLKEAHIPARHFFKAASSEFGQLDF